MEGSAKDWTIEILKRHLDRDFTIYPLGEGSVDEGDVRMLGERLGVRFPAQYVDHLCGDFPGVLILAKENVWPRPKAFDVGPFWSFLYGVHSYTSLSTSEDWMQLEVVGAEFQRNTGLAAVPILQRRGDADAFCVDSDARIMAFDHETGELSPVDLDFWDLFEREIAELAERKNRLTRERSEGAAA